MKITQGQCRFCFRLRVHPPLLRSKVVRLKRHGPPRRVIRRVLAGVPSSFSDGLGGTLGRGTSFPGKIGLGSGSCVIRKLSVNNLLTHFYLNDVSLSVTKSVNFQNTLESLRTNLVVERTISWLFPPCLPCSLTRIVHV